MNVESNVTFQEIKMTCQDGDEDLIMRYNKSDYIEEEKASSLESPSITVSVAES